MSVLSQLTADEIETLRLSPLFREMSDDVLEAAMAGATVVDAPAGDVLFNRRDPSEHFYVVVSGWVKVYRDTIDGEEAVLGVFAKGESLAEAAAFLGQSYPASAAVVEQAKLLRIPTRSFVATLQHNPAVMLNMLGSMSLHLRRFMHDLEQLQTQSATYRVIEFLLAQSRGQNGTAVVTIPYDKMLLARRLGMKPESLSRIWSRLRQHGIHTEQNRVVIADVEKVRRHFAQREFRRRA